MASKQNQIEKLVEATREAATVLYDEIPLLIERQRIIAAEVRAVFAELLGGRRLKHAARRAVLDVFESLRESGMLDVTESRGESERHPDSDLDPDAQWSSASEDPFDGRRSPFERGGRSSEEGAPNSEWDPRRGGSSAAHVGGQADKTSVRELFRRLAIALHPDRTQNEGEKNRRTEVMKEVTRAYEEGDLARLVQLEDAWLAGANIDPQGRDTERLVSTLERVVADLARQLKELARKLRELQRTSPLQGLSEILPNGSRSPKFPVEALLAEAEKDLQMLAAVRDFARAFRDGRITLDEFLEGPPALQTHDDAIAVEDLDFLEAVLGGDFGLGFDTRPAKKKRKKKTRSRGRKKKA